jgi:hypothetical protein
MFRITHHRGFQIKFENGWTVSVQFGGGMYCQNYDMRIGTERETDILESEDAEIAAIDKNGELLELPGGDSVKGRVKPSELLNFMNEIANKE